MVAVLIASRAPLCKERIGTMRILMGVGNELLGDDGVGTYIADRFVAEGWRTLSCGTAPENFTSIIRRERPEILLIVDAADMGLSPGEFRIVIESAIEDVSIGTHQLPLSHLITYLRSYATHIIFIGIQPRTVEMGAEMSAEVKEGASKLIKVLESGCFADIPVL
jgi:hydrogenase 3 maturation protease